MNAQKHAINLLSGLAVFAVLGGFVLALGATFGILKFYFGDTVAFAVLLLLSVSPFAYVLGGAINNQ